MAEFDPEAYLEAKLQSEASGPAIPPPPPLPAGEEERPVDRDDGDRDRRRRSRSRDRDRRRSRSRDRDRDRDRDRRRDDRGSRRDRSPRRDARPRYDENYKPDVREGGYGGGGDGGRGDRPRHGRDPVPKDDEAGFERDLRTVFIAQVARKADERDLFAFFTECGKVTDVRIIKDTQTRRSKGIAYVEFESMEMCPAAVAKSGQIICGFPCIVQASQAEKNIAAKQEKLAAAQAEQPARVQVSNLHKDIGQDDLSALFSPFGTVVSATIQRENGPANSGLVTFKVLAEAQKAVAHLNGFDLAGMMLSAVLEAPPPPPPVAPQGMANLTNMMSGGQELLDDHETGGVQVTAQSRAALMQKLARGQDYAGAPSMPAPPPPPPAMGMPMPGMPMGMPTTVAPGPTLPANLPPTQAHPSEYMLLVNMFDPSKETEPNWHIEIQDDVSEECSKFGTVQKCIIDRANPSGLVYLKFNNPDASFKAAAALNGRFFAGKAIAALYLAPVVFEKFCPAGQ